MKRWLPLFVCLIHFFILSYLARQHLFGNYATETDFYHFYAPDAERIAAGQFPQNTFQGPGYPAILALLGKVTGLGGDLFTVGKWLSVVCAVLCGWLVFVLFARLVEFWVGLGAQLIAITSREFPQFSINAATDVFFLDFLLFLRSLALVVDHLIYNLFDILRARVVRESRSRLDDSWDLQDGPPPGDRLLIIPDVIDGISNEVVALVGVVVLGFGNRASPILEAVGIELVSGFRRSIFNNEGWLISGAMGCIVLFFDVRQ